jgi:hypothetical protein
MLTRQPDCETEIVPSLHSNLGAASPSGAGLGGIAAVCCAAGVCATGFGDQAQPAHENKINSAEPGRIGVAFGNHVMNRPQSLLPAPADSAPQVVASYNGGA